MRFSDLVPIMEDAASNALRMGRAQEMGFDTSRVWYHGSTGTNIEAFDPARMGRNTGAASARKGFFFASTPEVAASYGRHESYMSDETAARREALVARMAEVKVELADIHGTESIAAERAEHASLNKLRYQTRGKKQIDYETYLAGTQAVTAKYATPERDEAHARVEKLQMENFELEREIKKCVAIHAVSRAVVHPVYLRLRNPVEHDQHGEVYREITYNDLLVKARRGRRDGLIIRDTYDPGYRGANAGMCDIAVVFDPAQVRSTHARFDLAHAESGDLLA